MSVEAKGCYFENGNYLCQEIKIGEQPFNTTQERGSVWKNVKLSALSGISHTLVENNSQVTPSELYYAGLWATVLLGTSVNELQWKELRSNIFYLCRNQDTKPQLLKPYILEYDLRMKRRLK